MGACSSVCDKGKDVVADGKAAAQKALADREKAAAEALEQKIKDAGDIKLDAQVEKDRAYLRAVLEPLTAMIIEYERADSSNASSLRLDHLAAWTKLPAPVFCGDAPTGSGIFLAAARVHMVAEAFGALQADPFVDSLASFKEVREEMRACLKKIDVYLTAEIDHKAAKLKHTEADAKFKESPKAEADEAKLEKVKEKLEEAADAVKESKAEALAEAKSTIKGAEQQIKKAFDVRDKGMKACDKAVLSAADAKGTSAAVKDWEPEDKSSTLGALAANAAAAASIAASGVGRKDLAADTSKMLGECKRLLGQVTRNVEAWASEEASKGMVTLHGPKLADEHLTALAKALSEGSGAKALVSSMVYKVSAGKEKKVGTACEKFVEEAQRFLDGLEAVADALKEYEAACKVRRGRGACRGACRCGEADEARWRREVAAAAADVGGSGCGGCCGVAAAAAPMLLLLLRCCCCCSCCSCCCCCCCRCWYCCWYCCCCGAH
jgi:hypothetical protein